MDIVAYLPSTFTSEKRLRRAVLCSIIKERYRPDSIEWIDEALAADLMAMIDSAGVTRRRLYSVSL